jgi:fumarate hydratase, class II
MSMSEGRVERDSMGEVVVPAGALYGAQTARAAENFPISHWRMPREFVRALGRIKAACAASHKEAGRLESPKADAIISASMEVAEGRLDKHFVVDVFQTGSGTSTNMNANEVIANRAIEILGGKIGDRSCVHPNDDVNKGQSSNDVIPTALHVSAAMMIDADLLPALDALGEALSAKARDFEDVVKIGRTHLMDAVPIRLGQEFSGYAAQIEAGASRVREALDGLCELAIGGTAVGTGLNAPDDFAGAVCRRLASDAQLPFREAANHFAAQGGRDAALAASGAMRSVALAMGKVASDIRLLGSGPRCGLGELQLPALQPGSSIMPGKVNPVLCESVVQVACQVVGCDAAIAAGVTGGVGGILELNVAMPMIAWNLLTEIRLLAGVAETFRERCIEGLHADTARCEALVEQSLAMVTALVPALGYDMAARIAKEACETGRTIREVCLSKGVLEASELARLLDAGRQTGS